jgi:hypothetical protein
VALLLARDRWPARAHIAGVPDRPCPWLLLAQRSSTRHVYGAFGSSLWEYVKENVAGTLSSKLFELGEKTGSDDHARPRAQASTTPLSPPPNRAGQEAGIEHPPPLRAHLVRGTHLHTLLSRGRSCCLSRSARCAASAPALDDLAILIADRRRATPPSHELQGRAILPASGCRPAPMLVP